MADFGGRMGGWLAAASLAGAALHGSAFAQVYPTKPIHMSTGFAAGGPADIVSRVVAQPLGAELGQVVCIVRHARHLGACSAKENPRAATAFRQSTWRPFPMC